ncbi:MAG TPA: hypothetical protein VKA83_23380, partial [Methylomirabilota bacterium]|nr:hypothetical protein [Methylomirabilota bacterium]
HVGQVRVAQHHREGRHHRILAPAVAVLDELPVGEVDRLAGEGGRARNGRVAVAAVARRARLGLAPARLEVRGERRGPARRPDERDGEREAGEEGQPAQGW